MRSLAKSLQTRARTVEILKAIDLDISRGEFVAILGPSGSGKTSLLGLLAGLDRVDRGTVIVDGEDLSRLTEDELATFRGRKIGIVFQSYHLIPTLTAEENVRLPMEFAAEPVDYASRARELLDRVGLRGFYQRYPVELSGGEQQRVALARALACKPAILLADEPTGNLDSESGALVLDLMTAMHREEGTTLVLVTHDAAVAGRAHRRIFLRDGVVVKDAS